MSAAVRLWEKARREASAEVALTHATNPHRAQQLDARFGGDGKAMTQQDVEARFGAQAATHWQAVIDARLAFIATATGKATR